MSKQALFVDCVHEFEMYRTLDSLADIYDKIDFATDQPVLRLVKKPAIDYSAGTTLAQPGFSQS